MSDRATPVTLRSWTGNLRQGVIDTAIPTLTVAVIGIRFIFGLPILLVGLIVVAAVSTVAVIRRQYLPMEVVVDVSMDLVAYRNAWSTGTFHWSQIERVVPKQVVSGHAVPVVVLSGDRTIELRGCAHAAFVEALARSTGSR